MGQPVLNFESIEPTQQESFMQSLTAKICRYVHCLTGKTHLDLPEEEKRRIRLEKGENIDPNQVCDDSLMCLFELISIIFGIVFEIWTNSTKFKASHMLAGLGWVDLDLEVYPSVGL